MSFVPTRAMVAATIRQRLTLFITRVTTPRSVTVGPSGHRQVSRPGHPPTDAAAPEMRTPSTKGNEISYNIVQQAELSCAARNTNRLVPTGLRKLQTFASARTYTYNSKK